MFMQKNTAINNAPRAQSQAIFLRCINSSGPFLPEQMQSISRALDADEAATLLCLAKVNAAARRLIICKSNSDMTKTQSLEDLQELRANATNLHRAIVSLGASARSCLYEIYITQSGKPQDYQGDFFLTETAIQIEEILLFSEGALAIAEAKSSPGAMSKQLERVFYAACRSAYLEASGDSDGWWHFFRTITEYLVGILPPHLATEDFKKWQGAWRKLGRGNNSRKNE
jgi:hypothetical protein